LETIKSPEINNDDSHFNLEYWLRIVYRRRKTFLYVVLISFVVLALLLAFSKKKYMAVTSIYFPVSETSYLPMGNFRGLQQMNLNVDLISQFIGAPRANLQDYALAILDSRTMRDKLIDKFRAEMFPELPPDYPRVKLYRKLNQVVNLQLNPYNIIEIRVETGSPEDSRKIAQFYADEYKKFEAGAMITVSKRKRVHLEKQKDIIKKKLNDLEYQLSEFEKSKKVVDIDSETLEAVKNLAETQKYYVLVDSEESRAYKKLEALKEKLKTKVSIAGSDLASSTVFEDPVISSLSTNIVTLQVKLIEEQKSKTEKNPDIIMIKNRIEAYRKQLKKHLEAYFRSVESNISPALIEADVEWRSLAAQKDAITDLINKQKKALEKYPDLKVTFNRLNRDIQIYTSILMMVEEEYEKARIEEEREGFQVQVLDEPNLPDAPSAPNVPYSLTLSLGYALLLGLTAVFYLEYTDKIFANVRKKVLTKPSGR